MDTYRIVRHFFNASRTRTVYRGFTLEEAQDHCGNRETSSSTATLAMGRARTREHGPWFDGYEKERP